MYGYIVSIYIYTHTHTHIYIPHTHTHTHTHTQECIYFVSGEGRAQCEMAPSLEKVKSNEYEVVFCTEPLDELCMMELKEIRYLNPKP